jgi:hypothetical protein
MTPILWIIAATAVVIGPGVFVWRRCQATGIDRWLPAYLAAYGSRRAPEVGEPIHLFLCVADHYEPKHGGVSPRVARGRVKRWVDQYPVMFSRFRDSDGRPPQHTFFYPADEYEPELLDELQALCFDGFGEIEIHLHHENDTSESLADQLTSFKTALSVRHNSLARDRKTGGIGYVFIHGNWALDNSRPDGRWCGVNDELTVLERTGCYADMTFPSYPSPTQPPTINTIYRAIDDPHRPRSHDHGVRLRAGTGPGEGLLMIPGPLVFDWTRKKFGLLPRIENGCLQASQPPRPARLHNWLRAGVRVKGRPDWYFVKLHTHGAIETNADVILGPEMAELHQELSNRADRDPTFQFHYVTAREMVNVALAAEAGVGEWDSELRNFKWGPPGASQQITERPLAQGGIQ